MAKWTENLRNKINLFFSIALAVLLTFLILTLFLRQDLAKRAAIIQTEKRELAARTGAVESLASLKSDAEKVKSYVSVLDNILPGKDQLIRFPRDMEDIAKQYGIDFGASFGAEAKSTESSPGYINFTFSLGGSYDKVNSFIQAAEKGRYIISWDSADLRKSGDQYKGTLSGRVFSR